VRCLKVIVLVGKHKNLKFLDEVSNCHISNKTLHRGFTSASQQVVCSMELVMKHIFSGLRKSSPEPQKCYFKETKKKFAVKTFCSHRANGYAVFVY
jgi:hypothetical protein